eukprot:g76523.t1
MNQHVFEAAGFELDGGTSAQQSIGSPDDRSAATKASTDNQETRFEQVLGHFTQGRGAARKAQNIVLSDAQLFRLLESVKDQGDAFTSLSFTNCFLNKKSVQTMSKLLRNNEALTSLSIEENPDLDQHGVDSLLGLCMDLPNLSSLSLWNNHLGERPAKALAKFLSNQDCRLRKLDLSHNQ